MKDGAQDPNPNLGTAADARLDARLRAKFTPPHDVVDRARRALTAAGVPERVENAESEPISWRSGMRLFPRLGPRLRPLTRIAAAALLLVGFGLAVDAWIAQHSDGEDGVQEANVSGIDWRGTYGELTAALARAPMPVLSCDASTDLGPYLKGGVCPDPSVRFAAGRVVLGPLECSAMPEASVIGIPGFDGKPPVFVIVTSLAPVPLPIAKDLGGLRLHRRIVGALDLYELTPLEEPSCLDLFQVQGGDPPPPSCSWTQVQ